MILDPTLIELVEKIKTKSSEKKYTISVAESCTGGLLSAYLTAIAGASHYFDTGIISYSNQAKFNILKVPEHILNLFGAVSEETAQSMAIGLSTIVNSNIIVSVTGIAGPDGGSEYKPIGTVCFGIYADKILASNSYYFLGNREEIRKLACRQALLLILSHL
jgi:nicotinamide-nucleotide amidase